MSVFAATLIADAAILTVDTAGAWPEGIPTALAGRMSGTVEKLWIQPSRHLVFGGAGAHAFSLHVGALLATGVLPAGDVDTVAVLVPEILKSAPDTLGPPPPGQEFVGLLAGWSSGPRLYVFQPPDYAAAASPVGGHTLMPAPSPAAPGYDEVVSRWAPAGGGSGVEDFHLAVLKNAAGQSPGGITADGVAIGGKLINVRVDKAGIHARVIGELPMPAGGGS